MVKNDYIAGNGSMRALAARHVVSESTLMKRARREHWHADRTLAARAVDTEIVATMQQRAEDFVNRSAEQTDAFMTRISESEKALDNEDRAGLRTLTGAFKDVISVGRDTYGLGNGGDERHCLVNLSFLQSYQPDISKPVVGTDQVAR